MKCYRCGKEMDNPKSSFSLNGLDVKSSLDGEQRTPENIEYANKQLGKYADGKGGCHVAICFECLVDSLMKGWE